MTHGYVTIPNRNHIYLSNPPLSEERSVVTARLVGHRGVKLYVYACGAWPQLP